MNLFQKLLKNRKSTRVFTPKMVENDKIEALKSAVLMSPSGKRINEWEFILINEPELLTKLSTSKEHGSSLISGAPIAFVVIGDTTKSDVWIEDCSIASIILQLQAEDLGLGSCWVQIRQRKNKAGELSENYVRSLLNIPAHYGVESIIAIGYKERNRSPFDESNLQREKIHLNRFQ